MLSAFITAEHGYPAMPLAGQLVRQWFVHPGPLVLWTAPFKIPTTTVDRDRQLLLLPLTRMGKSTNLITRRFHISMKL